MQTRRFKIVLWTILTSVAIAVVGFGVFAHVAIMDVGFHGYMLPKGTAELLIEHMKANQGAWPKNWEELHKTFLSVEKKGRFEGVHWEDYQRNIGIDFTANPVKLTAAAKHAPGWPPFRVIWQLDQPDLPRWRPIDPNEYLAGWLREHGEGK
jgi:hypothetical protein